MLTQTTTLRDAARSRQRVPYIRAVIDDVETRWATQHDHVSLSSSQQLAARRGVLDDSRIMRVRSDGSKIQRQRITDWTDDTQYWSWTDEDTSVSAGTDIAIAIGYDSNPHIYYYKDSGGYPEVYTKETGSDGNTWSTLTKLSSLGAAKTPDVNRSLSATDDGYVYLLYEEAGSYYVGYFKETGAGWSALGQNAADEIPWLADTGLAAELDEDSGLHVIVVTYSDASGDYYATLTTHDPSDDSWGTPVQVYPMGDTSVDNLYTLRPDLLYIPEDSDAGRDAELYLSLCERWVMVGTISQTFTVWRNVGGNDADQYAHWHTAGLLETPVADIIRAPLMFFYDGSDSWLVASFEYEIFRARLYNDGDTDHRFATLAVLGFSIVQGQRQHRGWIDIDNSDNQCSQFGTDGQWAAAVKPWARCQLQLGYVTSAGNEAVYRHRMWVESAELIYPNTLEEGSGPAARLRIHVVGLWPLLQQFTVPHETTFTSRTPRYILRAIVARASGMRIVTDGSTAWAVALGALSFDGGLREDQGLRWRDEYVPPEPIPVAVYQVSAGATGLEVAWRMLRIAGGEMRDHQWGHGDLLDLKDQASASDYDVGVNGEIESARYGVGVTGPNRAKLRGDSGNLALENVGDISIALGFRLIESVETRDEVAATATGAELVAGVTHRAGIQARTGQIYVPLVPGIELFDQIDIYDARIGASITPIERRVVSITEQFDRGRSRYHMLLGLGGR